MTDTENKLVADPYKENAIDILCYCVEVLEQQAKILEAQGKSEEARVAKTNVIAAYKQVFRLKRGDLVDLTQQEILHGRTIIYNQVLEILSKIKEVENKKHEYYCLGDVLSRSFLRDFNQTSLKKSLLFNKTPLVSVGIPTYNRGHLIKRCIDSVLNQDYFNIEIVISDNGSTDETPVICRDFCAQYERIRYIRQPTNQGPSSNFKEVLQKSEGDFFMWLADDDWLGPSYISECISFFQENPDHSLVTGKTYYFLENNKQYFNEKEFLAEVLSTNKFIAEGERLNLWQETGTERVIAYYQQVLDNGVFYGLMRRNQLLKVPLYNTMGGDWLMIAAIAFLGKVKTLDKENVCLNRSRI